MPKRELNAIVSQRIEIAPGLLILRVVPDGWELPDFEPGQFAVLGLYGSAPRCDLSDLEDDPPPPDQFLRGTYSITSSSVSKEYLEFYIQLVRSGTMTPRIFALKPGDRLYLGPKFSGLFRLSSAPEDVHLVMVATGTGLGPYMSMLRTYLRCGSPRRYAIIHGARHSSDLGYRSELISLQRLCDNFTYIPVVSKPEEEPVEWEGHVGYVQDLWKSGALADAWGFRPEPSNTHIFLCGNPKMVDEMIALLREEGFTEHTKKTPGQIHVEKYW
ncbi:MAG: hypothetical protein GTO51_08080 [Candidatus Latescibacteria bacterium]|nr:hypothetical protein [Candidatus Latescibacterota bacterium]NIM21792.1 hypothetical protein [Candidatus Latescibacterota bacterium]NIM65930.1 hypothetical protein [Candidatus Latescibacterota bacterium]NIO02675.1 hypothetical protein [Candidatus Latescibacterota bacterium]NIO29656.1 hypothetical protein [Candidatus Latescibacterota bacterium]